MQRHILPRTLQTTSSILASSNMASLLQVVYNKGITTISSKKLLPGIATRNKDATNVTKTKYIRVQLGREHLNLELWVASMVHPINILVHSLKMVVLIRMLTIMDYLPFKTTSFLGPMHSISV